MFKLNCWCPDKIFMLANAPGCMTVSQVFIFHELAVNL